MIGDTVKIDAGDPTARLVTLRTPRLKIAPFTHASINEVYLDWLSDPEVNAHTRRLGKPRTTRASAEAWVHNLATDEVAFMIDAQEFGPIGTIKYGPVNWSNLASDVAILIGCQPAWGNGFGAEAIYALSRHLFWDRGVNRLSAASVNPGFIRAVEKLGWRREGVQRQEALIGGRFLDSVLLSKLKDEFRVISCYEPSVAIVGEKN